MGGWETGHLVGGETVLHQVVRVSIEQSQPLVLLGLRAVLLLVFLRL